MPLLKAIRKFFVDAFTRFKKSFTQSETNLPAADSQNTVIVKTPEREVQNKIDGDSSYLLTMPPGIRDKALKIKSTRGNLNASLMDHAGNHSTIALLNINGMYFCGVNNVHPSLTPRDFNTLKILLKTEKSLSGYSPLLSHPEADAILKAFKQQMHADRATMFIERKQCSICARREFNDTDLRRLLPVLSLKELTVYTTNSMGQITRVVLSPFFHSNK
jgi:hypothetical protein